MAGHSAHPDNWYCSECGWPAWEEETKLKRNMMQTIKEMKAALDYFEEHGKIESRDKGRGWNIGTAPYWNFGTREYRPVPKKLECWVNVYSAEGFATYPTKARAQEVAGDLALRIAVHMVEADEQG